MVPDVSDVGYDCFCDGLATVRVRDYKVTMILLRSLFFDGYLGDR